MDALSKKIEITFEWETEPDREAFKRIMADSFLHCYKDIPKSVLKVPDVKAWLTNYFSDGFLDELKKSDSSLRLAAAKIGGTPAGYVVFDMKQYPQQVYICEMAVDPAFQRRGIGKRLVFSLLEKFSKTEKIVLVTRKINAQAQQFYSALGFRRSDYIHEGYDPEVYMGFELMIPFQKEISPV